jgi:hypothetical protein
MERGSIDVTGLLCVPCQKRGHTCYAHGDVDGEPQCVFCQDGEPCGHDQRNKVQPRAAISLPPIKRPAKAPARKDSMQTQTKTNGHAPDAAAPRLCKCGCGEVVPAENRFSYVKGHMTRKSKATAAPKAKLGRPKKIRASETAPDFRARAPERLTLHVTEPQLNSYLVKLDVNWKDFVQGLPAKLKLEIANAYLQQSEVAA